MVGSSNVYVSVTRALDDEHRYGYQRPRHTWMISTEPHHTHVPGMSRPEPHPVHYAATRNEDTGGYAIGVHEIDNEPAIIGNILVAESAHVSTENLHKTLQELITPNAPSKSTDHDGDEMEHWVRIAIRGLQQRKIVQSFDLDEFMTFARGYEASRMENEAPALVAYPKIHKDHEKKKSKHRFWVSHPMAGRTKTNYEGEAMTYGGLM